MHSPPRPRGDRKSESAASVRKPEELGRLIKIGVKTSSSVTQSPAGRKYVRYTLFVWHKYQIAQLKQRRSLRSRDEGIISRYVSITLLSRLAEAFSFFLRARISAKYNPINLIAREVRSLHSDANGTHLKLIQFQGWLNTRTRLRADFALDNPGRRS